MDQEHQRNLMNTFEVAGFGYDGSTDETDDRVIWVKAPSHAEVQAAIAGTKAGLHDAIDAEEVDIDFVLPAQAESLKAKLLGFECDAQLPPSVILAKRSLMLAPDGESIKLVGQEPPTPAQAKALERLNTALTEAVHDAVNAACLRIQEALGVDSGDYAGMYFCSGSLMDRQVRGLFAGYLISEVEHGEAAPKVAMTLNCYVKVKGTASDPDDERLPGFYLSELELFRHIALDTLADQDRTEIAKAVLNSFHESQGIEVLDDFEISVHLPDGTQIEEGTAEVETLLVLDAEYCGKVDESELPFMPLGNDATQA